jgi:hypothetical protein
VTVVVFGKPLGAVVTQVLEPSAALSHTFCVPSPNVVVVCELPSAFVTVSTVLPLLKVVVHVVDPVALSVTQVGPLVIVAAAGATVVELVQLLKLVLQ